MLGQTAFRMQAVCRAMTSKRAHGGWQPVPPHVDVSVQVGDRYGVLLIDDTCFCCNNTSTSAYFFRTSAEDEVYTLMSPEFFKCGAFSILLPNGTFGFFEVARTSEGFHDGYILDLLAYYEEDNPSFGIFFAHLQGRIRLRTAFRNLYFRAFRKAFAPTANQGRRMIRGGVDFLEAHFADPDLLHRTKYNRTK